MLNNVKDLPISTPLKPRGDRIVVLPFVQAGSSFLLNMEENREKPERGIVIEIGPGATGAETGRFTAVEAQVGQLVCYGKYAGLKFEVSGPDNYPVDVYIMRDSEVLLYQDAGSFELVMHEGDPRKVHEAGLTCEHCEQKKIDVEALRDAAYGGPTEPAVRVHHDVADLGGDADAAIEAERRRLVLTDQG